jgi:hypothetical protein
LPCRSRVFTAAAKKKAGVMLGITPDVQYSIDSIDLFPVFLCTHGTGAGGLHSPDGRRQTDLIPVPQDGFECRFPMVDKSDFHVFSRNSGMVGKVADGLSVLELNRRAGSVIATL